MRHSSQPSCRPAAVREECEHDGATEPQPGGNHQCGEQDGGSYVFRAYVGDRVWSTRLELESDGCHIAHGSGPAMIEITGEGEPAAD